MPHPQQSAFYFPALTGLRAFAAYLVFFHHFNPVHDSKDFLYKLLDQGYVGVSIFYVLSGLLICVRYYDRVENSKQWIVKYLWSRIARIYPLYLLLTILTLLAACCLPSLSIMPEWQGYNIFERCVVFVLNITLTKGLSESFKFSGIQQAWSLTVELGFYFISPLFLLLLRKNKGWLFAFPLCLIVIGVLLTLLFSNYYFYGLFGSYNFLFNYTFFGRCFEFFIGVAVALVLMNYPMYKNTKYVFTITGGLWIVFVISILAYWNIEFRSSASIILNNFLLPIGIGFLLYGIITENSFLQLLFSSRWLCVLGESSYAFYLIHMGVFSSVLTEWLDWPLPLRFIVINIISIALYKFLEKPLNNWMLHGYFGRYVKSIK